MYKVYIIHVVYCYYYIYYVTLRYYYVHAYLYAHYVYYGSDSRVMFDYGSEEISIININFFTCNCHIAKAIHRHQSAIGNY